MSAAATVTNRIEVNDPTKEVVVLTVSDGEHYVSKKFATVLAVQATFNEDAGAVDIPISCAISGGTVTLHCTDGVTPVVDLLICLTLYGRK